MAPAFGAAKVVMEGVPSTRYAIKVDTTNGRVDIGTTSYTGGISNVGLFVASNTVIGTLTKKNAIVLYSTGSAVVTGGMSIATTTLVVSTISWAGHAGGSVQINTNLPNDIEATFEVTGSALVSSDVGIGTRLPMAKLDIFSNVNRTALIVDNAFASGSFPTAYAAQITSSGTSSDVASENIALSLASYNAAKNTALKTTLGYPPYGTNNFSLNILSTATSYFAGEIVSGSIAPSTPAANALHQGSYATVLVNFTTANGTIGYKINVTSVTHVGAGSYIINFATPYLNTSYACFCGLENTDSNNEFMCLFGATSNIGTVNQAKLVKSIGAFQITAAGNVTDDSEHMSVSCYGAQ